MASLATSQRWFDQTALLLEARPLTTRISFRYSIKTKTGRRTKKTAQATAKARASVSAAGQNPRAVLVLKTSDTVTGVCLKYKTNKAAEVSRLIQLLGQLSRRQAGLLARTDEPKVDDVAMAEAPALETPAEPSRTSTPVPAAQSGAGGKGKKKKGKK